LKVILFWHSGTVSGMKVMGLAFPMKNSSNVG